MKRDQPSSTSQPAIDCGADGVDHATVIWRQVFERSDFAIALGDRDGRTLLAVNPAFARMHQRGVDELAGAAIIEVFAPQAREAVTEHIRIANGSSHYAWESEHIRADESQFPVQIDVTPIRDDQGNLLFRVVYVQDISGRRRAEQALRDSESRLRLTVEVRRPPQRGRRHHARVLRLVAMPRQRRAWFSGLWSAALDPPRTPDLARNTF